MKQHRKAITKEQYERAQGEAGGYIAEEDMTEVFRVDELYGYGVYSPVAHRDGDEYYCTYYMGDTCD